jgi:hypothetical protein
VCDSTIEKLNLAEISETQCAGEHITSDENAGYKVNPCENFENRLLENEEL